MKKVFKEYNDELVLPYDATSICLAVSQYAKDYIYEDREALDFVDLDIRDAVLIDIVNYLGTVNNLYFKFTVRDLYNDKFTKVKIDGQSLLNVLFNHLSVHLYNDDIVNDVMMKSLYHNCVKSFKKENAEIVIIDFINYISEKNEFYKVFTTNDIKRKYNELKYKNDMNEIKKFLEKVTINLKELNNGKSFDDLYNEVLEKNNLKYISRTGNYYFNSDHEHINRRECMNYKEKLKVDKDLYPIAYLYGKLKDKGFKTNSTALKKKVLEMKKR